WRIDCEPGAHSLYDARGLSLSGSFSPACSEVERCSRASSSGARKRAVDEAKWRLRRIAISAKIAKNAKIVKLVQLISAFFGNIANYGNKKWRGALCFYPAISPCIPGLKLFLRF